MTRPPDVETLRGLSVDLGPIMETVSNVLPDSWQAAGQGVIDAASAPMQRMAQDISPAAYAQLDAQARGTIDRLRAELGLSPINPEAPIPGSNAALPAPVSMQASGTSGSGGSTAASTGTETSLTDRVVNPVGIGCAIVGSGAAYVITGRSEKMKARRLARIAVSLAVGLAAGVTGGAVRHATSSS